MVNMFNSEDRKLFYSIDELVLYFVLRELDVYTVEMIEYYF
jgi:hypothetical protein